MKWFGGGSGDTLTPKNDLRSLQYTRLREFMQRHGCADRIIIYTVKFEPYSLKNYASPPHSLKSNASSFITKFPWEIRNLKFGFPIFEVFVGFSKIIIRFTSNLWYYPLIWVIFCSNMSLPPTVTGISPKEGPPGTRVTIRGENLGREPNDLIGL